MIYIHEYPGFKCYFNSSELDAKHSIWGEIIYICYMHEIMGRRVGQKLYFTYGYFHKATDEELKQLDKLLTFQ